MSQKEKNVTLLQLSEENLISQKVPDIRLLGGQMKVIANIKILLWSLGHYTYNKKQYYSHQLLCCVQVAKGSVVTINILVLLWPGDIPW